MKKGMKYLEDLKKISDPIYGNKYEMIIASISHDLRMKTDCSARDNEFLSQFDEETKEVIMGEITSRIRAINAKSVKGN